MKRRGFDRRTTHVSSAHVNGKLGRPCYQGVTLEPFPPPPPPPQKNYKFNNFETVQGLTAKIQPN